MWSPSNPDRSQLPVPGQPPNGSQHQQHDEAPQARPLAEGLPQWDLEPPANVLRRPER